MTTPVGTVDVLPSIVDVLVRGGVSASVKDDAWIGRSLVTLLEDATPAPRTLFATVGRANERKPPRHAVRHEGYKYIATQSDGREELYEPARDPVERSDLVAADASALQRARTQLAALTEPLNASGVHVELSNDGDVAVDYRVSLRVHPAAPFVNLHRLALYRLHRHVNHAAAQVRQHLIQRPHRVRVGNVALVRKCLRLSRRAHRTSHRRLGEARNVFPYAGGMARGRPAPVNASRAWPSR